MIGWIINCWLRWRLNKERQIFRFWDGRRRVAGDPMLIWFALKADPELLLERHIDQIYRGDDEAIQIGVRATQRAFGVKPVAEGGLTVLQSLDLLIGFIEYLDALKKNTSPTPISPVPMAESPSSVQSATSAA